MSASIITQRPADLLAGHKLPNGWNVIRLITRPPFATGGYFSVGYIVTNDDGREGFMKVIDYSSAFGTSDAAAALLEMTKGYVFEREVMLKCSKRRMSRVVKAIDHGDFKVPGVIGYNQVSYLIFEKADTDVRNQLNSISAVDIAWVFRALHHIAVGVDQLHKTDIAHQDIKPSNILDFKDKGNKLTDLGRAWSRHDPSPVDSYQVPGDHSYAPPELIYGIMNGNSARFMADLYLLGSMIFVFFCKVPASVAWGNKLGATSAGGHTLLASDWASDLPLIQNAFQEALDDLGKAVEAINPFFKKDVIEVATELCQPDPNRRGDRFALYRHSLERYISRFDRLARLAEHKLKAHT